MYTSLNAQPTQIICHLVLLLFIIQTCHGGSRESKNKEERSTVNERIIGGVDAPEGRFPYMCSIQRRSIEEHACGGILIGCRWVLTAAHCFRSVKSNVIYGTPIVRCGIHKREDRDELKTFSVHQTFIHEEWNGKVEDGYDIALLKLDRNADLQIPDLDQVNSVYNDGVRFAVAGWGLLGPDQGFSKVLQVIDDLPFVSLKKCNLKRVWNRTIKQSMVCAGFGNGGACEGDSGGPLLSLSRPGGDWEDGDPRLDVVVGISSYGKGSCDNELPGIYTKVGSYRSWISNITQDVNDDCWKSSSPSPYSETAPSSEAAPSIEAAPSNEAAPSGEALPSSEGVVGPLGCGIPDLDEGYLFCIDYVVCPRYSQSPNERIKEALDEDNSEKVREYLCCGLHVNDTIGRPQYPLLTFAARSNAVSSIEILLRNNADINGVDIDKKTALIHAVLTKSLPAFKKLIACGADVNKADQDDRTPLHYGAAQGNIAIVEILLDAGASSSVMDYENKTPYDLICSNVKSCSNKMIKELKALL